LASDTKTQTAAAVEAPWQPGHVLDGRYELIKLVGSGGMGVVWRVFDREWGRDLALKLPRPAVLDSPVLRERYVREAETWIGLGVHPHIVQCWFVTEVQGIPALFLDYLTGGSLKSWIDAGHVKPGQWGLIIEIAMQVAEGLAYAHSKGVIHRDVKPENLLIRGDERVCVTDFGLVKTVNEGAEVATAPIGLSDESSENPGMTGTGAYLGTPMYGAPEQWGAAERVGPPADIYALGVTLYEMCCGRRPFDSQQERTPPLALIQRHLKDQPPDPREFYPNIPSELAKLCLLMLAKDPAKRPPQMLALREFLCTIHQKLTGRIFRAPAPLLGAQSPDVLNNQAVSLSSLGKLTQAVETLRRGLRLDPGHPECLYNLVQLEKRHGRIGHLEALRRLKQARAFYPLALLMVEEGLPADAYEILKNVNPDELSSPGLVYRATGDALMYLGSYPAAQRAYAQAQELMPKDSAAGLRHGLATAGTGKTSDGVIHFPSFEPLMIGHSGGSTQKLMLDHKAEGLLGLTQRSTVYLSFHKGTASAEIERPPGAGLVLQTWLSGQRLAVAYSKGFECLSVPTMTVLARRRARVLACSPRIDRMVTLEQAGPQLFTVENGHFQPITMEGQSPDQGPLLAAFDPSGQHLGLLLPSGQLAALDANNRAVIKPWPARVEGHREARCLALTGDGAVIIGFADGTIRSYNVNSQSLEFSLHLSDAPRRIEVLAGGCRVVVRGRTGFQILCRTGEVLLCGDGPLAIDPQGRRALFFFQGRQVMYNLNPLHVLRRWGRPLEGPQSVAFSGDGRTVVSLSGSGEYVVWEMDEPHRVYQRELLMSPGRGYADILSADEQFRRHLDLASQALDRGEQLESHRHLQRARRVPGYSQGAAAMDFAWQLLDNLERDQLEAVWERLSVEGSNLGDVDLAPEGRQFLFAFGNRACLALDQDGGARPVWTLNRRGRVRLMRFVQRAESTMVVIADESGEVGLHQRSDGRLKHAMPIQGGPLAQVLLHGTVLTYLCRGGGFGQLDLADGANSFRDDLKISARVFAPWQRDKVLVATATSFGVLDLKRPGSKLQALRLGMEITKVPNFVQHIAERDLLVLGFTSGTLRVLDVAGGRVLAALKHGEGTRVTSFELLPDLGVALTTTSRGYLCFWDLRKELLLDKFVAHRNGISVLRTSSGGRYLLTAGGDGIVRYWETSWSAGEVRCGENEIGWLSKGKRRDRFSKLLGRGGSTAS
jgi:WD40 repeat protein/tetratricopeptide (TPR) repeat protein